MAPSRLIEDIIVRELVVSNTKLTNRKVKVEAKSFVIMYDVVDE